MTWTRFLFDQTGRVGRVEFCFSLLAFLGFTVITVGLMIGIVLSLPPKPPEFVVQAMALASLAIFMTGLFAMMTVGAKRLHDRGKSALWMYAFFVLPALIGISGEPGPPGSHQIPALQVGLDQIRMLQGSEGRMGGLDWLGTAAAIAILLWGLVELCCLPGTAGPNKYGPVHAPPEGGNGCL